MDIDKLTTLQRAYIECALWAERDSVITLCDCGTYHPSAEDITQFCNDNNNSYEFSDLDISKLSEESSRKMVNDCIEFEKQAKDLIIEYYNHPKNYNCSVTDMNSQIGHDFWLTKMHHGAGFWDRGLGQLGRKLTDLSQTFKEQYLYINNGVINLE